MQQNPPDRIVDHRLFLDNAPVRFVRTTSMGVEIEPVLLVMHSSRTLNVDSIIRKFTAENDMYSAHLVIARDGSVTQFVPFNCAAWHATKGYWGRLTAMNGCSIGIEMENAGPLGRSVDRWVSPLGSDVVFPDENVLVTPSRMAKGETAGWSRFTSAQMDAAIRIGRLLVEHYALREVLGTGDVLPDRASVDPGPAFDMAGYREALFGRRDPMAPPPVTEKQSPAETAIEAPSWNVAAPASSSRRARPATKKAAAKVSSSSRSGEISISPASPAEDAVPGKMFIVHRDLNVRQAPRASGAIVAGSPLPTGTLVEEMENSGSWKRVRVTAAVNGIFGITGWVNGGYLREAAADVADPPGEAQPEESAVDVDDVDLGRSRPPDLFTAEQLGEQYGIGTYARTVVAHAIAYAAACQPAAELTTTFLLISIAASGKLQAKSKLTTDWLRQQLGRRFERLRDEYFNRKKLAPGGTNDLIDAARVTDGVHAALERAAVIAEQVSGDARIRVRHLMAALLTDARPAPEGRAMRRLDRMGIDAAALRRAFFVVLSGGDNTDDADAWGTVLLGAAREDTQPSGYNADATDGADYLGIGRDVGAFAALIAARTLSPPLSIGLFGEWGSGKTFFMRALRDEVARLARLAREKAEMQCRQPFYKRVVQIEFNAWHYSEGNLWASLVQHIFENLRLVDDRQQVVSEKMREPLLRQLGAAKEAAEQARRDRRRARAERRRAEREVGRTRKAFEEQAQKLAELSGENFLRFLPIADVMQAVQPTFTALELNTLAANAIDARAALGEARALLSRGSIVVAPLLYDRAKGRRWIWLGLTLLAGPAAALVVARISALLGAGGISDVARLSSGAAALVAAGTAWVRRQLDWVGGHVKKLEAAQRTLDARIADAQARNATAVRRAEEDLRLREAGYQAACRKEDQARRQMAEAHVRVQEASVSNLLRSFVEERANSTDYRKHLGVLALIRNDFERLSNLIEEENWRLSPAPPQIENPPPFPSTRFESLADEVKEAQKRINRIVLYIDDLDRCPPAKVVEVLQAVHLLLAFPLFVVVVGVDARWVTRSLEARYRETLTSPDGDARGDDARVDEFSEIFGTATSHDYLEKIFQVPFWLRPMTDRASRTMVTELLRPSMAPAAATTPPAPADVPADEAEGGRSEEEMTSTTEITSAERPVEVEDGRTGPAADVTGSGGDVAGTGRSSGGDAHAAKPEETPEQIFQIVESELRYIEALVPLLGRSPRALKRFVNVYRLIKARLTRYERDGFMREEDGDLPEFAGTLLLLAIDTGAPLVSRELCAELQRYTDPAAAPPERTLAELAARLERDTDAAVRRDVEALRRAEWQRVRQWLAAAASRPGTAGALLAAADAAQLARGVARVSRFSFHTGRVHVGATEERARFFQVKDGGPQLRERPNARARRVAEGALETRTVVRELEERGEWKRVAVVGDERRAGWIPAETLQRAVNIPGLPGFFGTSAAAEHA